MNKVFIGVSLDGYIADKNGGLDWLNKIPNPDNQDLGYQAFMTPIEALVMGRNTFETILGFDMDWPYQKPVFVLSTTLRTIPKELESKVFIKSGPLNHVVSEINQLGYNQLYIDGGKTIQRFLKADLIDEITTSTIPILLGGGTPLFDKLQQHLNFELSKSTIHLKQIVQTTYRRKR